MHRLHRMVLLSSLVGVTPLAHAICAGNIEMHGNKVINVAMTAWPKTAEVANKRYTDTYLLEDHNRRNGTLLSASKHPNTRWVDAQAYCANLASAAIRPDGSLSDKVYRDWYLPTRVEYLAACLAHGSYIDYAQKIWRSDGICATDAGYFWLKTYHLGPMMGAGWEKTNSKFSICSYYGSENCSYLTRKKNWMLQAGKGELFNPQFGDTMRDDGDKKYSVRCMR